MKHLQAIVPSLLATFALSCGGGGGGSASTTAGANAPTSLSFAASDVIYLKGVAIKANVPSVSGGSASWSSSPALPPGLSLDATTGAIRGVPAAQTARATYTITASNSDGSTSANVRIAVELPPRFAFAANRIDNTVSLYLVDGETGQIKPNGFIGSNLTQVAPQRAIAHPSGKWVYTPNLGNPGAVSPNISVYAINATNGRITPGTPAGTSTGPFDMVIAPSGLRAYLTAQGSNSIWRYSIHPQSGLLSPLSAPITADGTAPTAIQVHPDSKFAYVAFNGTERVGIYDVHPTTGDLALNTLADLGARPHQLQIDPDGARLYVTDDDFRLLLQYDIDPATGALALLRNRPIGGPPTALAVHPTGRWIYAARDNGTVRGWQIDPASGALTVVTSGLATGSDPVEISFDAGGRFAYVTNRGSNEVAAFEVDLGTGDLTPASRVRTRATPGGFTTTCGIDPAAPEGRFVYTANEGSDSVTPYVVNAATGQLTAIAGPPTLTEAEPRSVAADPLGRFVYVVNADDRSISAYSVDAVTGALAPVGLPLVFGGSGMPRAIAVDGSGRFAFVSNAGGAVEAFRIDQGTGELAFAASTPSGGLTPDTISVDPTGQFIYVANLDSSNVNAIRFDQGRLAGGQTSQWVVSTNVTVVSGPVTRIRFSPGGERAYLCIPGLADQILPMDVDPSSGALAIGPAGTPDGDDPVSVAIHPNGRWAYAALQGGPGAVAGYDVAADTGALTQTFELAIGLDPIDLKADPSGRFLFVVNEVGGDISVFDIDPATGQLAASGAFSTDLTPKAIELVSRLQP